MRRILATATCLALALGLRSSPGGYFGSLVFTLSIKGKSWNTGVILNPGVKPPIGKIDDGRIASVLQGTLPDFAAQFLTLDAGGRIYLYYQDRETWHLATNPNGTGLTTLTGQVANDGVFWMSGPYVHPMMGTLGQIFLTGKVKFERGSFTPSSIKGEASFVGGSPVSTGITAKFKTVGGPE